MEAPKQEPEVVEKKGKKPKWTEEEWAAWDAKAKMQKQKKEKAEVERQNRMDVEFRP